MCLAQGHNVVNLFGLQPATFRGAALHKKKEIKRERDRERQRVLQDHVQSSAPEPIQSSVV